MSELVRSTIFAVLQELRNLQFRQLHYKLKRECGAIEWLMFTAEVIAPIRWLQFPWALVMLVLLFEVLTTSVVVSGQTEALLQSGCRVGSDVLQMEAETDALYLWKSDSPCRIHDWMRCGCVQWCNCIGLVRSRIVMFLSTSTVGIFT